MLKYTLYFIIFILSWYYQKYLLNILENKYNLFLINILIYWFIGIIYICLDYYKLDIIEKYKVNKKKESICLRQILPCILLNHVVSFIIFIIYNNYVMNNIIVYYKNVCIYLLSIKCILFFILFDIIFYIGHRIIHLPLLYKHIHKKHHNINANIAISGYYMTVSDYLIEFMLPLYIPIYILNNDILVLFICSIIGQINGLISHSGYDLPCVPYEKDHLYHHLELHCNYGVLFMDKLFDTKRKMRKMLKNN